MTSQNPLAVVGKPSSVAAILSPLRRDMLALLHRRKDSAVGLARRMKLTRQKCNYHVRMLEREGFLEAAGEEKRRGCTEKLFRPTARAYVIRPDLLIDFEGDSVVSRDRFSSAYLIYLAARTLSDVDTLRRRAERAQKKLATLALEVDVRFSSPADRNAFARDLTATVARLAERYQSDSPGSRSFRFVVGGHPLLRDEPQGDERNASQGK